MSDPRTRRRPSLVASVEALERRETPSQASITLQALYAASVRAARLHTQAAVVAPPKSKPAPRMYNTNFSRAVAAAKVVMERQAASFAARLASARAVTPAGLAVAVPVGGAPAVTVPQPDSGQTATALTKANSALNTLYDKYQAYLKGGSEIAFDGSTSGLKVRGTSVLVDVRVTGDAKAVAASLSAINFQVQSIDARLKVIEGYVPIDQLSALDGMSSVVSISGVRPPMHG
ncbi:hypothetical protein EP7_002815 [Isosphaeraceae bacterium EP7]